MDNRIVKTANFSEGVRACLPTVMGYLGIGIAMGIVGKSAHLAIWQVFLMSTLIYAGSAQFILCGLLLLHAPIISIVFTVFPREFTPFIDEPFRCSLLQGGLFGKRYSYWHFINR